MINAIRKAWTERGYAVLRIMVGILFAFHGMQKVLGVMNVMPTPAVGSQIWIGGLIELVTGAMIAVGILTHWAAFVASGTMAVAYFQFHWKFQFDSGFFPGVNGGESAVVYCFLFLYIFLKGAGLWSIDASRGKKNS